MKALCLRHLQWLEEQHIVVYTVIMAAYSLLGRIVLALILSPALCLLPKEQLITPVLDIPWQIPLLVAPIVETLMFQWVPIWLAESLRQTVPIQIAVSTALFSLMHYSSGILGVLAAVASGLAFAYAWVQWRKKGLWWAIAATALTHFWVNAAAYAVIALRQAVIHRM